MFVRPPNLQSINVVEWYQWYDVMGVREASETKLANLLKVLIGV